MPPISYQDLTEIHLQPLLPRLKKRFETCFRKSKHPSSYIVPTTEPTSYPTPISSTNSSSFWNWMNTKSTFHSSNPETD